MQIFSRLFSWLDNYPRIKAFVDKSAWLLIAPALLIAWLTDPILLYTVTSWCVYAVGVAGVSVMISRLIFPQARLTEMIESALYDKNTGAGLVAAGIILFVGIVMISIIVWSKV